MEATEASLHQPVYRVPGEAVSSSSPQTLFFVFFSTFPTSTPPWLPCFVSLEHISAFFKCYFLPRVFSASFAWTNPLRENSKLCSRWTKTVPGGLGERGARKAVLGDTQEWGSDLTMLLCSFHYPSLSPLSSLGEEGYSRSEPPFSIGTLFPVFPSDTPCSHPWKLWQVEPG